MRSMSLIITALKTKKFVYHQGQKQLAECEIHLRLTSRYFGSPLCDDMSRLRQWIMTRWHLSFWHTLRSSLSPSPSSTLCYFALREHGRGWKEGNHMVWKTEKCQEGCIAYTKGKKKKKIGLLTPPPLKSNKRKMSKQVGDWCYRAFFEKSATNESITNRTRPRALTHGSYLLPSQRHEHIPFICVYLYI